MDSKRTLAALAVAALVAFPAGATAKSSNSGGKGVKGPELVQDDGAGKKGKKPKKPKVKTYQFKGVVAAVNNGTVEVTVTGGNRRARELERQTLTFDVTKAKVKVADVNGDGKRDLADVAVGDRVMVQAKVAGPVDASRVVPARHLLDKGPAKPPSEDDAPKPPETETPPVTEAPAA
jgi:acylphosphatase